jgi:hypothetical protein
LPREATLEQLMCVSISGPPIDRMEVDATVLYFVNRTTRVLKRPELLPEIEKLGAKFFG